MVRVEKLTLFLPRDAMRYSAVFAVVRCPSVRLSITVVHCIETAKDIVKYILGPVAHHSGFFVTKRRYSIPRGTPSAGAKNTRGCEKFAIFD